jgi:hypothetical protein
VAPTTTLCHFTFPTVREKSTGTSALRQKLTWVRRRGKSAKSMNGHSAFGTKRNVSDADQRNSAFRGIEFGCAKLFSSGTDALDCRSSISHLDLFHDNP